MRKWKILEGCHTLNISMKLLSQNNLRNTEWKIVPWNWVNYEEKVIQNVKQVLFFVVVGTFKRYEKVLNVVLSFIFNYFIRFSHWSDGFFFSNLLISNSSISSCWNSIKYTNNVYDLWMWFNNVECVLQQSTMFLHTHIYVATWCHRFEMEANHRSIAFVVGKRGIT